MLRRGTDKQTYQAMHEVTRTVQFQRRHFVFWLIIILFAVGLTIFIQYGRFIFADEPVIDDSVYESGVTATLQVDVTADGRVMVDGEPASIKVFQPYAAFDELKYKVLDKPQTFIDALIVRVSFETPLPPNTVFRSFAIHGVDFTSEEQIDAQTIEYQASGIGPEATYTIVAQLPKGVIEWPAWRDAMATLNSLPLSFWLAFSFLMPFITLIVLIVMFWPAIRGLVGAKAHEVLPAPPQALPPAVVGILVNGRVSAREIAATLLDLAQRGYLTIFNKDDAHFTFAKRRAWTGLQTFELILLTQLFQVKGYKASAQDIELSVGETLFSPGIAKAYLAMYDAAVAAGYFKRNPAEIHRRYRLIGLLLFFIGLAAFTFIMFFDLQPSYLLFIFAGMMTMALVIIVAADEVPLLTSTGELTRRDWLAFRNYLRSKELIGYTEGAQAYYERFLPYAVVLQSEVEWVNRFSRHPFQLPSWYDATTRVLAIEDFARGLYGIVGNIAELFSSAKEPSVH